MKNHLLILPYEGSDAVHVISSMQKQINRAFLNDVKMIVSYTGKKLSTCFNFKDKTIFNNKHDIMHYAKCPEESFLHDYVGVSRRRVLESVKHYYNARDHFLPYFSIFCSR